MYWLFIWTTVRGIKVIMRSECLQTLNVRLWCFKMSALVFKLELETNSEDSQNTFKELLLCCLLVDCLFNLLLAVLYLLLSQPVWFWRDSMKLKPLLVLAQWVYRLSLFLHLCITFLLGYEYVPHDTLQQWLSN